MMPNYTIKNLAPFDCPPSVALNNTRGGAPTIPNKPTYARSPLVVPGDDNEAGH